MPFKITVFKGPTILSSPALAIGGVFSLNTVILVLFDEINH